MIHKVNDYKSKVEGLDLKESVDIDKYKQLTQNLAAP